MLYYNSNIIYKLYTTLRMRIRLRMRVCVCIRAVLAAESVLRMKKSDVSVTYPLHLPGTLPAPTEVQ